jgi:hypothetical protein
MEFEDPMTKKQRIEPDALARWRNGEELAREVKRLLANDTPKAALTVEAGANSTIFVTWYGGSYRTEAWRLDREREARRFLAARGWQLQTQVL